MKSNQFYVSFIKEGIIRISKHQSMPQSYLERYGIVSIPQTADESPIKVEDTTIALPDGRVVSFDVRPETDDALWQNEYEYLCNKFAEKIPKKIYIEGRPNIEKIDIKTIVDAKDSDRKFGISFKIGKDEKFYGLGESGRDRIQLRGTSSQNWTIYQFNEIPIPFVMSNTNIEVHYDEDATRFYLYHNMTPNVKVLIFGIAPTKDEYEVRNLIASNIEEHIEEYLGSVITEEDIA